METNRSQQIQAGLFLAVGLIAALASILILGSDTALLKSYVTIYSRLAQVQGLNNGSVVSLAGMSIGNVKEMKFADGENALVVALRIEKDFLDRIPNDSMVEVRTQGALGDKYIYIIPGNLKSPRIQAGGELQPNSSPDLMGVLSERGGEAGKIFDIMTELHKLLLSMNGEGRLERILNNVQESTLEIKGMSKETRELIQQLKGENPEKLKESMKHLSSILAKVDKGEGTLGALINDPSLHQQLKALIGESPRRQYMQSVIRSTIEKSEGR